MRGINKVILVATLGKDPELKTFANGGSVCNVSAATSEEWKDKHGEKQKHTEWHNLQFNDRLAEIADEYLRKGSKVYIEGKLKTRKWEKDGQTRYITEIRVDELQMLDSKPADGAAPRQQREQTQQRSQAPADTGFSGPDDDIPF